MAIHQRQAQRGPASRYRSAQGGFSLAELAIVLVLVGLLSGLVIMGDGILTQSRIKSLAGNFEQLRVAVLTYQDRYGAIPGDDARAAGRWVNGAGVSRAKDGSGDGRISGSYQDPPPGGDPLATLTVNAAQGETLNFWWHMRLAELVVAPPPVVTPVAQPLNFYAGVVGVEWAAFGFPRLSICTANVPGEIALGVENQLDDGQPRAGLIRAARQNADNEPLGSANATVTSYGTAETDFYILCRRLD
jgi:prepilin-type N-terminal cleavage/methylation domain-containing protein